MHNNNNSSSNNSMLSKCLSVRFSFSTDGCSLLLNCCLKHKVAFCSFPSLNIINNNNNNDNKTNTTITIFLTHNNNAIVKTYHAFLYVSLFIKIIYFLFSDIFQNITKLFFVYDFSKQKRGNIFHSNLSPITNNL